MKNMRLSSRGILTVIAAILIIGGLVRLTTDTRRAEVSLPDAVDARAQLGR